MSTTSITLQHLVSAQKYIMYINCIMFVGGFIGNSLNILIFTKLKLFRNNRSIFYLIVESIANIIMSFQYFIHQLFQLIYEVDPSILSIFWCKAKTTSVQTCRLLISSVICFEAFDQFLSTHHQSSYRQLSTLKLGRYLIWITSCLWFFQSIPYIIFYEIVPESGCIITNRALIHYYSYCYYIFLNGLIPICVSSLFSLLAYRNVRHLIRLQIPIERRRLDRQMTAMIFARVIAFVILLTPYTVFRIYILNVNTSSSDILHNAINQLISVIVLTVLTWIYSVRFLFEIFE